MSAVTCHVSSVKAQPRTLHLLTPLICTVGCFAKTQNQKKFKAQKIIETGKQQNVYRYANITDTIFY